MKEKRTGAYLTVFLSLLLASFLAFIMALSDGIQRNTMLVESEIALDTACYSALAEYHKELLKQYDLFFIDSSYGYSTPGASAVGDHIKKYAQENLSGTNFLDMEVLFVIMK